MILTSVLAAGCGAGSSASLFVPLAYTDTDVFNGYDIVNYTETSAAKLMGENFGVISEADSHMTDAAITAPAALLINVDDNEVIFAENIYQTVYPASITKLLTALVVLKHANLEDTVTVSYNASHIPVVGAKLCGFEEGDRISVETLLGGLLVYSGNDAGLALAEHIAGSEEAFVQMMNEEAMAIGAVNTHFVNSHGLHDDDHYTTAYDMYMIFKELLASEKFVSLVNLPSYTAVYTDAQGNSIEKVFESTNLYFTGLAKAPSGITVIGAKTGTTSRAGYCLALYFKDREGTGYIAEIYKADNPTNLYEQISYLMEQIP